MSSKRYGHLSERGARRLTAPCVFIYQGKKIGLILSLQQILIMVKAFGGFVRSFSPGRSWFLQLCLVAVCQAAFKCASSEDGLGYKVGCIACADGQTDNPSDPTACSEFQTYLLSASALLLDPSLTCVRAFVFESCLPRRHVFGEVTHRVDDEKL